MRSRVERDEPRRIAGSDGAFGEEGLRVHPLLLAAALAVTVQSGTPQTAQAWVAARADRYETHFNTALVVKAGAPAAVTVK